MIKKLAAQTVLASALASTAFAASATTPGDYGLVVPAGCTVARDTRTEKLVVTCPPAQPSQTQGQGQGQGQAQGQLQGQGQNQGQNQTAAANAAAAAAASSNAGAAATLTDNSRTTQQATQQTTVTDNSRTTQQTTVTDQSRTTQDQAVNVRQGDQIVRQGDQVVNQGDTKQVVGPTTQHTTYAPVTNYRAAANRAAPDAAAVISDGTCKTGWSVSAGVGTLDVNAGGSVAVNNGWSDPCAKHEMDKLEATGNIVRETNLRASENPVDNALAHEQAKAGSAAYRTGTAVLEKRIETLGGASDKPLEVRQGDGRLLGLNVVVKKPVQTTIVAPAPAPVPAPQGASAMVLNFTCATEKAAPAPVRRAAAPAAPAAPVATGCSAAEIAEAVKRAQAAPTAKP